MGCNELLVLHKELKSLLDKGFISESKSLAAAPVLFAKKPGGGRWLCMDYCSLNAITQKDQYPLLLILQTFAALSKAKRLTNLDVTAAFHRISMAKGKGGKLHSAHAMKSSNGKCVPLPLQDLLLCSNSFSIGHFVNTLMASAQHTSTTS